MFAVVLEITNYMQIPYIKYINILLNILKKNQGACFLPSQIIFSGSMSRKGVSRMARGEQHVRLPTSTSCARSQEENHLRWQLQDSGLDIRLLWKDGVDIQFKITRCKNINKRYCYCDSSDRMLDTHPKYFSAVISKIIDKRYMYI